MSRESIFAEIERERAYQDNKWGGAVVDDSRGWSDWLQWITEYAYGSSIRSKHSFRTRLVKVAALAVAAIESFDRKAGTR